MSGIQNTGPILTDHVFEKSLDLILVTDHFGKFVRISPSSKEILGYQNQEMVEHLASDFLYPPDLEFTRHQLRMIRYTGSSSSFHCRYVHKNGNVIDLIWKGVWIEEIQQYFFIGRAPTRPEFFRRLDALDGFQASKGLFAASLVLAWLFNIGNNATLEIRHVLEIVNGQAPYWVAFMAIYSVCCLSCLFYKINRLQFAVSLTSVMIWTWMGVVTILAPKYAAAAGIYELILGVGSICVLYFHGRRL